MNYKIFNQDLDTFALSTAENNDYNIIIHNDYLTTLDKNGFSSEEEETKWLNFVKFKEEKILINENQQTSCLWANQSLHYYKHNDKSIFANKFSAPIIHNDKYLTSINTSNTKSMTISGSNCRTLYNEIRDAINNGTFNTNFKCTGLVQAIILDTGNSIERNNSQLYAVYTYKGQTSFYTTIDPVYNNCWCQTPTGKDLGKIIRRIIANLRYDYDELDKTSSSFSRETLSTVLGYSNGKMLMMIQAPGGEGGFGFSDTQSWAKSGGGGGSGGFIYCNLDLYKCNNNYNYDSVYNYGRYRIFLFTTYVRTYDTLGYNNDKNLGPCPDIVTSLLYNCNADDELITIEHGRWGETTTSTSIDYVTHPKGGDGGIVYLNGRNFHTGNYPINLLFYTNGKKGGNGVLTNRYGAYDERPEDGEGFTGITLIYPYELYNSERKGGDTNNTDAFITTESSVEMVLGGGGAASIFSDGQDVTFKVINQSNIQGYGTGGAGGNAKLLTSVYGPGGQGGYDSDGIIYFGNLYKQ